MARVLVAYFPDTQVVQVGTAPPILYVPATQGVGATVGSRQEYPAGHGLQVDFPVWVLYMPSVHVTHRPPGKTSAVSDKNTPGISTPDE